MSGKKVVEKGREKIAEDFFNILTEHEHDWGWRSTSAPTSGGWERRWEGGLRMGVYGKC